MKKNILVCLLLLVAAATNQSIAFCGFYVARAEAQLFNKTSQVILVRNGENTTVTMSSDFKGNVSEFAMVIPVPVVLKRNDIKVVDRRIFDLLDAYSGPRLVEYTDASPCQRYYYEEMAVVKTAKARSNREAAPTTEDSERDNYKVAVVARYTVGEYDIQILSALQSDGLARWLNDHGYKVPEQAAEMLEPYIKGNMKFFVVKVNLEEQKSSGANLLRPIQITFTSQKFMLPIRLGMANGEGMQDMIIYTFTQRGRVEPVNYRSLRMPTDRNVPEFVKDNFGTFYTSLYKQNLRKEGNDNIFLEYAWDLSGQNQMKCDPCASEPPLYSEIREAGVDWLQTGGGNGYTGSLFFTRMHVSYDRSNFPQDLIFQETPDRTNFQCRYVLNHPAPYYEDCDAWKSYQEEKVIRRKKELLELAALTGWDVTRYSDYPYTFKGYVAPRPPDDRKGHVEPKQFDPQQPAIPENKPAVPQTSRLPEDPVAHLNPAQSIFEIEQDDFLVEKPVQNRGDKSIPWGWVGVVAITGLAVYTASRTKS